MVLLLRDKILNSIFYPGTFDPITNGHLNILQRACKIYDHVTICILNNPSKKPAFSVSDRVSMIRKIILDIGLDSSVSVDSFNGLAVDFMRQNQITVMLRGIRLLADFESEMHLALHNKQLYPSMETIFLFTDPLYFHISSSSVKEIYRLKGFVDNMVHPYVMPFLEQLRV